MIHEFKPSIFPWSLNVLNQELFCKCGFWEPVPTAEKGLHSTPQGNTVSLEEEGGGMGLCSAVLPMDFCVSIQHIQHSFCVCVLSCIQLWDPMIGHGGHKSRSQLIKETPNNKNKTHVDIIQRSFTETEFIFHKTQPLKDRTWWLLVRSQLCYNQHCVLEYFHHPPSLQRTPLLITTLTPSPGPSNHWSKVCVDRFAYSGHFV